MPEPLTTVVLEGLVPRSLGNYLATLGALRLAHRAWADARLAWQGDVPVLVGVPSLDALADHLMGLLGKDDGFTRYELTWQPAQKQATKDKKVDALLRWEAEQPESQLELYRAHLVANKVARPVDDKKSGDDRAFNPLLGSGGNAGKRRFDKGWAAAHEALKGGGKKPKKGAPSPREELLRWLGDEPLELLGDYSAASWFMESNKRFNQGWSGDSNVGVSPWAMLCACEGLPLFGGATSRRLGARARGVPAFPFSTSAPAARTEAEQKAQTVKAELWLPVWERPMALAEIEALFARSRAEVGGMSASSPALFAAAVMQRGVDSGIREFRRFSLLKTTSANTFESRLERVVAVPDRPRRTEGRKAHHTTWEVAVECLALLYEALPRDEAKRFGGYRGGLEDALVRLAASDRDPEVAWAAVDAAFAALVKLDRQSKVRSARVRWPLLPKAWIDALLPDTKNELPVRIAQGLASIGWGAGQTLRPLLRYRLGAAVHVRDNIAQASLVEPRPASVVMNGVALEADLVAALRRLLVEAAAETDPSARRAMWSSSFEVSAADIETWLLDDSLDDEVARWLARFMLFDWRKSARAVKSSSKITTPEVLVAALLQAILRADDLRDHLNEDEDEDSPAAKQGGAGPRDGDGQKSHQARQAPIVSSVVARLVANDFAGALARTQQRLMAVGVPIPKALIRESELDGTKRLAASLLFPMSHHDIVALTRRWLRPKNEDSRRKSNATKQPDSQTDRSTS